MSTNVTWRPIHNYEGFYEISNTGNVRSIGRVITLSNRRQRAIHERMLKAKLNGDGYLFVTLSMKGIGKTQYIHRLVAQAFLDNPNNLSEVNHLSGDKKNNTTNNLEWVTHGQNVQHAYDNDLTTNKGANHTFAVGVVDNALGQTFETVKEWCEARGINYSTGRNILSGCNKPKIRKETLVISLNETNNGRQYDIK